MNGPSRPGRDVDALLSEWAEVSGRTRPPEIRSLGRASGQRLLTAIASATAAVVVMALIGVALVLRSSPAALPATPAPTPVARAVADGDPFRLVFEMPRTTWREGEAIEGLARLELVEGDTISIGPPLDGALGFAFEEVDGDRMILPLRTGCRTVELWADDPIALAITKAGEWWSGDPDGDFFREFSAAPDVRLPPGEWEISAVATFHEGGCQGPDRHLRATIRVTVEPGP